MELELTDEMQRAAKLLRTEYPSLLCYEYADCCIRMLEAAGHHARKMCNDTHVFVIDETTNEIVDLAPHLFSESTSPDALVVINLDDPRAAPYVENMYTSPVY